MARSPPPAASAASANSPARRNRRHAKFLAQGSRSARWKHIRAPGDLRRKAIRRYDNKRLGVCQYPCFAGVFEPGVFVVVPAVACFAITMLAIFS